MKKKLKTSEKILRKMHFYCIPCIFSFCKVLWYCHKHSKFISQMFPLYHSCSNSTVVRLSFCMPKVPRSIPLVGKNIFQSFLINFWPSGGSNPSQNCRFSAIFGAIRHPLRFLILEQNLILLSECWLSYDFVLSNRVLNWY